MTPVSAPTLGAVRRSQGARERSALPSSEDVSPAKRRSTRAAASHGYPTATPPVEEKSHLRPELHVHRSQGGHVPAGRGLGQSPATAGTAVAEPATPGRPVGRR